MMLRLTSLPGLSDGKGNFTYVTGLAVLLFQILRISNLLDAYFRGDCNPDLLIAESRAASPLLFSNGDGTFQFPVAVQLPSLNCEVNYAAAADLNGDGHTDVVVAYPGDATCGGSGSTPSGYFVALGKGDGTFSAASFTAYGAELYSVTIADMSRTRTGLLLDDVPANLFATSASIFFPEVAMARSRKEVP